MIRRPSPRSLLMTPALTMLLLTLVVAGGPAIAAAGAPAASAAGAAVAERAVVAASAADVAPPSDPPPPSDPAAGGLDAEGLDAELLRRFEAARAAAARDGVSLTITSGRRTADEQRRLVADALDRYGDATEAHRWVAPPETSSHVLGTAVDVGGAGGASWLAEHGAELGLCQVFANEPWHFEATVAPGGTCPDLLPDASGLWR